jgi:hypothetical protein
MTSRFIDPLDLKTIYLNYFLGNQMLFSVALILIVSFVSAYLNISNKIFLFILAISSLIMGAYLGQGMYVFVLFLVGFFVYKSFIRLLQ